MKSEEMNELLRLMPAVIMGVCAVIALGMLTVILIVCVRELIRIKRK